jgi:hypothetical protein
MRHITPTRRAAPLAATLVALGLLLARAVPAGAEVFLDVYAGYALTADTDIETRLDGAETTLADVELDDSFVVGGRLGYWFTTVPFFGLALDVSYFRPDIGAQTVRTSTGAPLALGAADVHVVNVGPQLLVKLPLPVVKPYAFAGPAAFVTVVENGGGVLGLAGDDTAADAALGLKAGVGIRFVFFGFLGVFAEYQFTRFSPEVEFSSGGVRRRVEADVETHHGVIGATIQF